MIGDEAAATAARKGVDKCNMRPEDGGRSRESRGVDHNGGGEGEGGGGGKSEAMLWENQAFIS